MANPLKLVSNQPKDTPGVVASAAYAGGRRVAEVPIDEAGEWSRKPGHVVWIGLHEPSLELLRKVQGQFGLHELAIEDALKAHQRPKLEQYGEALFIVARTAQMLDGRIAFGETHLFVGRGYVISVRHGASTSYTPVRERCEAAQKAFSEGEDFILYAILDFIVDNYTPVLETVQTEVEEIEDSILGANPSKDQIGRIYQLRRDLLRLRNAAVPLVEVCRRLEKPGLPGIDAAMSPLFLRQRLQVPGGLKGWRRASCPAPSSALDRCCMLDAEAVEAPGAIGFRRHTKRSSGPALQEVAACSGRCLEVSGLC
jgi:magnesium transporter